MSIFYVDPLRAIAQSIGVLSEAVIHANLGANERAISLIEFVIRELETAKNNLKRNEVEQRQ